MRCFMTDAARCILQASRELGERDGPRRSWLKRLGRNDKLPPAGSRYSTAGSLMCGAEGYRTIIRLSHRKSESLQILAKGHMCLVKD